MDEHLTKPLDLKKFKALLGQLIAAAPPPQLVPMMDGLAARQTIREGAFHPTEVGSRIVTH